MDWSLLRDHLDEIEVTEEVGDALLGYVKRAERIICPYPNPSRQTSRTALLEALIAYSDAHGVSKLAEDTRQFLEFLGAAETGYGEILQRRTRLDMASLTAEERALGVMRLAALTSVKIEDAVHKRLEERGALTADMAQIELAGSSVDVDALTAAMTNAASMTLMIEAYQGEWFNAKDVLVLPSVPSFDPLLLPACELGVISAMSWSYWKRIEESVRFLDGQLQTFTGSELPASVVDYNKATEYSQPNPIIEVWDHISNKRLERYLTQSFFEMMGQTNLSDKATGLSQPLKIEPGALVSADEGHAAVMLCHALSRQIMDDKREYHGLRLVEWLRGYAVLQQYVRDNSNDTDPESLLVRVDKRGLKDLLNRFGLADSKATKFISLTLFRRSSRDLFDHPVIETKGDFYLLFGPALKTAGLSQVILSTLSNLKCTFDEKGAAFEDYVLDLLNAQDGVEAKHFKTDRDGSNFEFDVLARFDDHIFLFECKTHALSNYVPQNIFYAMMTAEEDAGQVERLNDALSRYPDILDNLFGPGSSSLPRKACVLSTFPFAIPGGLGEVGFIDSSILSRFFTNRYLREIALHQHQKTRIVHRVGLLDVWKAEKPSAKALLEQIESPFQVSLAEAHIKLEPAFFELDEDHIVGMQTIVERPITTESVAEYCGVDIQSIRDQQKVVADSVGKMRRRDNV